MLNVFKSAIKHINILMENGKQLSFHNHRYETDDAAEIAFLNKQIEAGHVHIYVDDKEVTVDKDVKDPLEAIKEKVRQELLAEMAAATRKDNDAGSTESAAPASLGMATTASNNTAPDSNSPSQSIADKLAAIRNANAGGNS